MSGKALAIAALMGIGGGIYFLFGLLHVLYTFFDIRNPRRLVPDDPAVQEAMARSGVRLSHGTMSVWDAWVGFNFSHGFGAILLGGLALAGAIARWPFPPAVLALFAAFSALYLVVGLCFWFRAPTGGIAVATACFLAAWLLAIVGGAART